MTIHFGLKLDGQVYSRDLMGWVVGPSKMLELLAEWLGLQENFREYEYIRIEHYRKAIDIFLQQYPSAFFSASYQADPFATASEILLRRDELKSSGFDFSMMETNLPERLFAFCGIETILNAGSNPLPRGECEIIAEITILLPQFQLPFNKLLLYDMLEHFPPQWQKIVNALQKANGVEVQFAAIDSSSLPDFHSGQCTDLQVFQQMLATNKSGHSEPLNDGSLVIVRAEKENDLAEWAAKLLKDNPTFCPVFLLPEASRLLDSAFVMEGVPAMGIASASSARSVLQLLKLVTAFLWKPVDPYRIMEFLSLPLKPVDDRLARVISQVMSEKPGLYSQLWAARIQDFWEKAELRYRNGREAELKKIKSQYAFWFERRRYEQSSKVPKVAVISVFEFLRDWAAESYGSHKSASLLVLASQSDKIVELLQAISQKDLGYLELERIVRVVYASSPLMLEKREKGSPDYCQHGGAVMAEADSMVWWNFTEQPLSPPVAFWSEEERSFLDKCGCSLLDTAYWTATQIQHRNRPVLAVRERLFLLIPQFVRGSQTLEHSLMGYIKAAFKNYQKLEIHIDSAKSIEGSIARMFRLQEKDDVQMIVRQAPDAFIKIPGLSRWKKLRDYETPTSLEDLLYFPYKWAFNYKAKLQPGAILSVAKDSRLMGNLAHRVFELMLKEDFSLWNQSSVSAWIDNQVPDILFKEGATFLMYGREQEKSRFVFRLKYAAWTLITLINKNGWKVVATEHSIEGDFNNTSIRAKLDLLLERGDEKAIVDLKWSGYTRRKEQLKNMEDLQLVMYADLLKEIQLPYTAYYILDNAKMLARDHQAFREAEIIKHEGNTPAAVHNIIANRMISTFDWRKIQLENGIIEMRTKDNAGELESVYDEEGIDLLSMLEMKRESAMWDDYKTLTSGIR